MSLPGGPLLIVSPHLDDAALSCAALLDRREPPAVVTVLAGIPPEPRFGWSERQMGFADSTATMTARRGEEEAALAASVRSLELMDLLDEDYLDAPRAAADGEAIRERVGAWLERSGGGTVALPAGAGRQRGRLRARLESLTGGPRGALLAHDDHLYVRDAALPAAGDAVLLYEELPYLEGGGAEREARRVARRAGMSAEPLELPVDVARKAKRIGRYASQIAQLTADGRRLDDPAELPTTERYWILRRS